MYRVLLGALILVACGSETPQPGTPGGQNSDARADPAAGSGAAVCLRGEPFVAQGPITVNGGAGGDAAAVSGLRSEVHDGCERFVIDLATAAGGAAARTGAVSAELIRELGVVRISTGVDAVDQAATEATLGGELARSAYAVLGADGRIRVDLHLGAAAEAHVMTLQDPARVVVDLRPGGSALPPPAGTTQRVVVLRPRPGTTSYPITITGYARTFESNVVARLEQNGVDVHETFTTATTWVDAWGHFEMTIPAGPSGSVTLHVGEYSAKDGTWEGVPVRLQMR
jgi:hypothetical protein